MSVQLIEQLAKRLRVPTKDVQVALELIIHEIKDDLAHNKSATIPGIGTFKGTGKDITFDPDETLSMTVNNRYAALENELVQLNLQEETSLSSENGANRNENSIDSAVLNSMLPQDLSDNILGDSNGDLTNVEHLSLAANPFDADLLHTDQENSFFSTPLIANDAPESERALDAASMKEEDPNSNHSEQEPLESNTEWSPFFEELEGEEFDIDTTIDLSSEDWETDFPPPPSTPFASSDSDNVNQDDLYFDVDADPDDTLFSPSANSNNEQTAYDNDLSWASNPLDDSADFFDDDPSVETSTFAENPDERTQTFSAEDEFFTPAAGSPQSPDDTLFSSDTIYSEDGTVEADDTIFLAPDQTVASQETDSSRDPYAPPASSSYSDTNTSTDTTNPYAYRTAAQRSKSSSWIWVAAAILLLVLAGGALYILELPPFGTTSTNTAQVPVTTQTPPETAPGSVPPTTSNPGTENTSNTTPTPDPSTASSVGTSTDPVQTSPSNTQTTTPPVVQRTDIDRLRGGWTIVVASELQRNDAERIADRYTLEFQDRSFPIGVLTTNQYELPRHRVGIGQFDEREDAAAILTNIRTRLPSDAWLLEIE